MKLGVPNKGRVRRRKSPPSRFEIITRLLKQRVSVKIDGKWRKISTADAIALKLCNIAADGDLEAARLLDSFDMLRIAGEEHDEIVFE